LNLKSSNARDHLLQIERKCRSVLQQRLGGLRKLRGRD
jgi:hypothetical protein